VHEVERENLILGSLKEGVNNNSETNMAFALRVLEEKPIVEQSEVLILLRSLSGG
jgi:hypothetical protein